MNILAIIAIITAGITFYQKVTTSIVESLTYFFPFGSTGSDYYRLKDDLTEEKDKELKSLTFSVIIVSIIGFILYFIEQKYKEEFSIYCFVVILVVLLIASFIYVAVIFRKKGSKIMSVTIDKKIFYLNGQIEKDTYIFRDSITGNYKKLITLSKKEMINAFSGYVDVKEAKKTEV